MSKEEFSEQIYEKLGFSSSDKFAINLSDDEKKEFQDKIKQTQGPLGKDLVDIPDKLLPPEEKKRRLELERANKKELNWLSYFFHWIMRLGFLLGKPNVVKRHEIKKNLRDTAEITGFYKQRFFLETLANKLDFFFFNSNQILAEIKINPFEIARTGENQFNVLKKDLNKTKKIVKDIKYKWQLFFIFSYPGTRDIHEAMNNLSTEKIAQIMSDGENIDVREYVKSNLSKVQTLLQQYKDDLEKDYNTLKNLVRVFNYNLEPMLKKFSPKYSLNSRKGSTSFRKVHEEELINDLISFYRYIDQVDIKISTKIYLNLLKTLFGFLKQEFNQEVKEDEINSFAINIINIIKEFLEEKYNFKVGKKKGKTDLITICLKAATKNEFFYIDTKYNYEQFVKDFFDNYKEDVRDTISNIQKDISEKEKNKKVEELFGGSFSEINPTYTDYHKKILDDSTKINSTFNYTKDVNVILKYLDSRYNQYEQALIDIINTNMLLDTYTKATESTTDDFEGIQKCMKNISDFLQMIVSPFRRVTEDTSRESLFYLIQEYSTNPNTFEKIGLIEDKVIKLDIAAHAVVEKFYSTFSSLHQTLEIIIKADKNAAIYRPDKNFMQNFTTVLKRIAIIKNNIAAVLAVLDFNPGK